MREDGLAQARRRRQRRGIIALAIAVIVVVVGFFYAINYMNSGNKPTAPSSCDVTSTPPPQSIFVLNVYNASSDTGSAKRAGLALKSHDFNVGTVSNDPYKESLNGVGEIRFGPKGKQNATQFVKKLMPGAKLVQDGRTDDSVDVVLGDQAPRISTAHPTTQSVPAGCPQPTE